MTSRASGPTLRAVPSRNTRWALSAAPVVISSFAFTSTPTWRTRSTSAGGLPSGPPTVAEVTPTRCAEAAVATSARAADIASTLAPLLPAASSRRLPKPLAGRTRNGMAGHRACGKERGGHKPVAYGRFVFARWGLWPSAAFSRFRASQRAFLLLTRRHRLLGHVVRVIGHVIVCGRHRPCGIRRADHRRRTGLRTESKPVKRLGHHRRAARARAGPGLARS